MLRDRTFGQKVFGGFAVTVALAIIISVVAIYALRQVVRSKDRVITVNAQSLIDVARLSTASSRQSAVMRGFLISKEEGQLAELKTRNAEFSALLARLRTLITTPESVTQLDELERADADWEAASQRLIVQRRSVASAEAVAAAFEREMQPIRQTMVRASEALTAREEARLNEEMASSSRTASSAMQLVVLIALITIVCALIVGVVLTRTLGAQIGAAVSHVQSSSTQLQTAASQQATGAREQTTAMSEIATTISELLATSRQIAESAQRVAHIADQTAGSATSGQDTVERANELIGGIRRQVDLVVNHMLDLGKKSQEIGAVLEIVSELAEQTNILAINATIEAAGAGESGKRFTVVADEIRKLADRVGASTKEIRGLIDDVRGAVNSTVMATEGGSKAVDAGSRQFGEVAVSFRLIAGLVSTTSDAAREIELSTKQQTSAVEQVNVAISNVAQATRETEASLGETLQTASQLAKLSRELARLIRPQAAA